MRADAQRNRERILDAAREVFAERGTDAPMSEVARRAGVGIATLARRFPTREDLVAATFENRLAKYTSLVEVASQDPDAWRGFCFLVERACGMQSGDLGFTEVLTRSFPRVRGLEAGRLRALAQFEDLVRRAQEAGDLREDFVAEDLPLVLMAHAGVVTATVDAAPNTGPRLVAYLLQSFAAPARGELPRPPTPRQISRALARAQFRAGPAPA
jgi:AcrR family transcriptional regulator